MLKKFSKIIQKTLPKSWHEFLSALNLNTNQYYKRISSLPIKSSGISNDGLPFVILDDGYIFHSYYPSPAQRSFYKLFLDANVKANLKEDCINVAYDIAMRYLGPASPRDQIGEGKYYEFAQGNIVIEVGAFMGYYAMRAAKLVGETGKVVAIEAVEENLTILNKNITANNIANVTVVPKAVWHSKGTLPFQRHARQQASAITGVVDASEEFKVQCDKIDNILSDLKINTPDFIRIQVNGAEREALAGMTETLKAKPKLLIAAIYQRDGKPSWVEIKSFLEERGYAATVKNGNVFATPQDKSV
jgi:FkbM family methyltransferase